MKYRWLIAPRNPSIAEHLSLQLGIPPLLAQSLTNRGFSDSAKCSAFLDPRLKSLADPCLLPNMEAAVDRLFQAHSTGEAVVIFGDYDVDGVTSTALLYEFLTALGWKIHCYLPHRIDEGYGLSLEAVENCVSKFQPKLLLAVDCGTNSTQAAVYLRERGVDLVIFDHHQLSDPVTTAAALVNPHLAKPGEPSSRELCSVGLAFKLAHAILKRGRAAGWCAAQNYDLRDLLDLVALGTIADLVPLTGENRIFVTAGLPRLTEGRRPGVRALKMIAQVPNSVGVHEVGYQLAPRLNAAGRLESATEALSLLLAPDLEKALPLATALDTQNRQRRGLEHGIATQVLSSLRSTFNPEKDFAIVAAESPWHIGVIGIVASRVVREFYRPTIILGGDGPHFKGSGRSIEGFDLAWALRECQDLLVKHGGHAMAAGLSILPERIGEFRLRLNELVRKRLNAEAFFPSLALDAEISLADISHELIKQLERLEPMGQGNPQVQFAALNVRTHGPIQRLGKERQHVKFQVTDGTNLREVLWFGCHDSRIPDGTFDLAFIPQINRFNGKETLQLKLLDWRDSTLDSTALSTPSKAEVFA